MNAPNSESGAVAGSVPPKGATLAAKSPVTTAPAVKAKAAIWLNGDVLACIARIAALRCRCHLWLMVADYSCGAASIDSQSAAERQAERLIAEHRRCSRLWLRIHRPPSHAASAAAGAEAAADGSA